MGLLVLFFKLARPIGTEAPLHRQKARKRLTQQRFVRRPEARPILPKFVKKRLVAYGQALNAQSPLCRAKKASGSGFDGVNLEGQRAGFHPDESRVSWASQFSSST